MGEEHGSKFRDSILHEDKLEKEGTDKQKRTMRLLQDLWPTTFENATREGKDVEGASSNSSYYRRYFKQYFGPADDKYGRTWEEIIAVYNDADTYWEHRYKLDNEEENNVPDEMQKVLSDYSDGCGVNEQLVRLMFDWAYERGVEDGRQEDRQNRHRN